MRVGRSLRPGGDLILTECGDVYLNSAGRNTEFRPAESTDFFVSVFVRRTDADTCERLARLGNDDT
jgi:hypothetical protein